MVTNILNCDVFNLFFSLFTGMVGWFLVNFCIRPWLRILDCRRKIYERLVYWANIYPALRTGETQTEFEEKQDQEWLAIQPSIRELAAILEAETTVLPCWMKFYARCRKYDLKKAASNLIGLSNSRTRTERILHEDDVRSGLNLPQIGENTTGSNFKKGNN